MYLGQEKTPFKMVETETISAEWLPYGVGIDVHLKFAIVSIVIPDYKTGEVTNLSQKVFINKTAIAETADWICEVLAPQKPPFNYVIESTSTYHFPFLRYFGDRMIPIVINPTIAGKDKRKTDKYDARKLAYHCMTGLWKPTPIVLGKQETLRIFTRNRTKIERSRIRLTNRMGTRLIQYGITFVQQLKASTSLALLVIKMILDGVTDFKTFAEISDLNSIHFEGIADLPEEMKLFLAITYRSVQQVDEEIKIFDQQIKTLIKDNWSEDSRLLQTIPGIGPKISEVFLAEIGNSESIKRFPSARAVTAFAGLSPEKKVSAGKMTSNLKRGGNKWIRPILVNGGQAVMRQDIPLAKWGRSIQIRSKTGGFKIAVVAIARRMCVAAYHVLRTQTEYSDDKSDYQAASKSTQKALDRIGREVQHIQVDKDDVVARHQATALAFQIANQFGGQFQFLPSENLTKNDVSIDEFSINKRAKFVLQEANIKMASQVYVAFITGQLQIIKGIGPKAIEEIQSFMLDNDLMKQLEM